MAFQTLKKWAEQRAQEYFSHISEEFTLWLESSTREGKQITKEEWEAYFKTKGMNSYERELAYPHMDDTCLADQAENTLKNCSSNHKKRPVSTYDEALFEIFVPLMIDRLNKGQKPAVYREPL